MVRTVNHDNLIAASLSQAYAHAKTEQADPPELGWTKEVLAWLLLGTWAKVTTDLFQVLAEEFVHYLDYDDTLKACVLGQDPFNNKGVSTSAGFGSLQRSMGFFRIRNQLCKPPMMSLSSCWSTLFHCCKSLNKKCSMLDQGHMSIRATLWKHFCWH